MDSISDNSNLKKISTSVFIASQVGAMLFSIPSLNPVNQLANEYIIIENQIPQRYINNVSLYDSLFEDESSEIIDTDVMKDDVSMTYEWLKDVDTSNWL